MLLPINGITMRSVILSAVLISLSSVALADDSTVAHYRFESQKQSEQIELTNVKHQSLSAGKLVSPEPLDNVGSAAFDGKTAIAYTKLLSNHKGLRHNFTWEGFFLSSASNQMETDGAINDRFITQFIDELGGSTRLTVGLTTFKAGGPQYLCIAFGGSANRHNGKKIKVIPDVWHHFAVVHEGTGNSGTITWYLDYELAGQIRLEGKIERTTLNEPGTYPVTIGARRLHNKVLNRGFEGSLDEVRLSSRPLKPEEFLRIKEYSFERNVDVAVFEDVPKSFAWNFDKLQATEMLSHEFVGFVPMPQAYSPRGYRIGRGRHAARIVHDIQLPAGDYDLLMRATADTILTADGKRLIDARVGTNNPLGDLTLAQRDYRATWKSTGAATPFELSAVFDKNTHPDVIVCYAPAGTDKWQFLGAAAEDAPAASKPAWAVYRGRMARFFRTIEQDRKVASVARGDERWKRHHEEAANIAAQWGTPLPSSLKGASKDINPIDAILGASFAKDKVTPANLVNDIDFLRRITVDVTGRIPTLKEIQEFNKFDPKSRREQWIDRLLKSDEWADSWVGYWQDVLAENPTILKPDLNQTGPFRKWIYESIRRNIGMDRFATELILMEGDDSQGGTAGFAKAADNDSPMAMKAHIIMQAFLAADMKCARCHDSPVSPFVQSDLFSLAALLNEKSLAIPATSVIPQLPDGRKPGVTASLKPGDRITPKWTLNHIQKVEVSGSFRRPRSQVAAIVTSPANSRFSGVMVNRIWRRFMGVGMVEPVDDWSDSREPANADLLRFLSWSFVKSGYDLKAVSRMIFNSNAYQRQVVDQPGKDTPLFASQTRRRMSAEQVIDSLHVVVEKQFEGEELTFDPNGTRGFINLGIPTRAWHLTSMSNERDRPALAMPVNQSLVDVLVTFGWRETRPSPQTDRDQSITPLQPLMIANGLLSQRLIRLTDDSELTEICLKDIAVDELVGQLFLRVLSREPDAEERAIFVELIGPDYEHRRTGKPKPKVVKRRRAYVDWDKHLKAEASAEILAAEKLVRAGEPPTVRLTQDFRERVEDALWSLMNSPEFLFMP
ncbi:MAG: hypothetical protein CMJ78_17030 [Planctomycetaceae bacterium]|nr:hypothetical protein [Planctomycetaceae bacterium]